MEKFDESDDWHREDILAAIRKKKRSLAALSREHGLSSGTLINALNKPWPRGENIIADIIGVPASDIWPSRYRGATRRDVSETPRRGTNKSINGHATPKKTGNKN
ncbi:helix-turn-helix domain-containing protein [Pantoea cypripedii]|uniref:helix-turn-helix domain-containing protein n=1 Tax=Pantoea cypripedii TaxID=55209 RepID=UPI000A106D47|nr:helix-turn-helix transcriptional regulator [Pantoea cypripedii]MBP2199108.1 lambda repressor-like predicted transcriptional regulator [Pantoea cypripedii]